MGAKVGTAAKYIGGIIAGAVVGWQISIIGGTIIIVITCGHGLVKYVKYRKDSQALSISKDQ
jgi:hypothetical protein